MKRLVLTSLFLVMMIPFSGCSKKADPSDSVYEAPSSNLLHFIGRASFRIETKTGLVIYIDPATGSVAEYDKPADLVLVTHQHSDHNKTSLVTLKDGGKIISCPGDIKSGETADFSGIKIIAVDAYNKNHPKGSGCGFIIEIDGVVIYHSGDTSLTEQMVDFPMFNIDYALLCSDGYYNMGPEEAMDAANLIEARYVIPIHSAASGNYSQTNMDKLNLDNKISLLPGEEITFGD